MYFWYCDEGVKIIILISAQYKLIRNGNRTEWSPIRSVIIRVITKSDGHAAEVRFVYHEYDYRPSRTTRSPITNRPFASNDHVVQNPPCWRASSLLFPHWDIKTKASQASLIQVSLF